MPSALERQGDFSQTLAGGKVIPITDPTTGKPFPGNVIPQTRLDINGVALLNVFPLPNVTDTTISKGVYNYVTQFVQQQPTTLDLLKLDYNIGPSDALSVTLDGVWQVTKGPNGGAITVPFPIVNDTSHSKSGMAVANYRHIFSPTMVNEFTLGYSYISGWTVFTPAALQGLQRNTYGFNAGTVEPLEQPAEFPAGPDVRGRAGCSQHRL